MKKTHTSDSDASHKEGWYVFRLYITGTSPNSIRAVSNIKKICDFHLPHKYSLEVIDIYQQGSVARSEQLVALPLLIKVLPLPERKMIGDLSDMDKVLKTLELKV